MSRQKSEIIGTVTASIQNEGNGEDRALISTAHNDHTDKLDELIRRLVPGSWQIRETSGEIMYRLRQGSEGKVCVIRSHCIGLKYLFDWKDIIL